MEYLHSIIGAPLETDTSLESGGYSNSLPETQKCNKQLRWGLTKFLEYITMQIGKTKAILVCITCEILPRAWLL